LILDYELSPMQRGMLATALASPEAGANIEQVVIRSEERFRLAFVERAWQLLTAELEALRVAFVWRGRDEPVQRVFDRAWLPLAGAAGAPLEAFLEEDPSARLRHGASPR
jgi:condensation domain-containing protein